MAKKAKKKSFLQTILLVLGVVLGIAGIFFLFGDGIYLRLEASVAGITSSTNTVLGTGFEIIFESTTTSGDPIIGLQIAFYLGVSGIALALIGLILSFVGIKKAGCFVSILGGLLAVVGGAMLFFSKSIIGLENYSTSLGSASYHLGWGMMLSAIGLCVGGIIAALSGMIGTLKK